MNLQHLRESYKLLINIDFGVYSFITFTNMNSVDEAAPRTFKKPTMIKNIQIKLVDDSWRDLDESDLDNPRMLTHEVRIRTVVIYKQPIAIAEVWRNPDE